MASVVIAQSTVSTLAGLVRDAGLTIAAGLPIETLHQLDRAVARTADVLILDVRGSGTIPSEVSVLKRRYPKMGVLLVAARLDPALMLEAMRAGVTEVVTDPVSAEDLKAAVERLVGQFVPKPAGEVIGFIGAKGGVGTTTVAANMATALATDQKQPVILVDLHVTTYGDASLLLGIEPRFSVVDALDNVGRLDESFLKGLVARTEFGLDVLASPERPAARVHDSQKINSLLRRLTDMYRWVVLDVPQSDLALIDALDPMKAMLLVVNQELPAVRRAAEMATLLRQKYGTQKLSMVINRFDAGADIRPDDVQKAVGLPVVGLLPADYKRVVAAANAGKPLVCDNGNRVTPVLKQLASRFATAPRSDQDRSSTSRTLNRLASLF